MKAFKLDNHPKIDSGFAVPPDYFETLSDKILLKINQPEKETISIFRKRNMIFAIAAVLILALMVPIFNRLSPAGNPTDPETLENYITYHADISDEDIVDLLESEDIAKIEINYNLEDKAIEEVLTANGTFENTY